MFTGYLESARHHSTRPLQRSNAVLLYVFRMDWRRMHSESCPLLDALLLLCCCGRSYMLPQRRSGSVGDISTARERYNNTYSCDWDMQSAEVSFAAGLPRTSSRPPYPLFDTIVHPV